MLTRLVFLTAPGGAEICMKKHNLLFGWSSTVLGCGLLLSAASCMGPHEVQPLPPEEQASVNRADPQMRAVLEEFHSLDPRPIETLTVADARQQPTIADALKKLEADRHMSTSPEPVGGVSSMTIPGPAGDIPVRIYTPSNVTGPYPTVVYFHGGGWVIGTLDAYDASCRALTNLANCQVISVDYRQAPEHKFPAPTEDAYAAVQYIMGNPDKFHADAKHIAVAGESAGGNIAGAVCLMARDRSGMMPVSQLLIYPVTDSNFDTESYQQNANAIPLDRDAMKWFFDKYTSSPGEMTNMYISILKDDLTKLPPATVITADIDPLRSEGQAYADKLTAAGVKVRSMNYTGVTHEFFGLGAVVDTAKLAERFAAAGLQASFAQ
jgi:acetyl esterase